jgi:uncharacterized membrane protein YkvA (DUF1232 family)
LADLTNADCGGPDMTAWRERARKLKQDVVAVALAMRDPRVPWYAKALGACVVAYALSPIDLIPDFIPVIGYLDDLVLVPLGLLLMLRLIPGRSSRYGCCRSRWRPIVRTECLSINSAGTLFG